MAKQDRRPYTKQQLESILSNEVSEAEGSLGDEVQENRAKALQYYKGDPMGNELPGRSHIISMDVADMVEAVNSMLSPMIAIDSAVSFEPQDDQDRATAAAESEAVNSVIMQYNQGYIEFQTAIKDALLLRNGWSKVWVEDDEKSYSIPTEGLPDESVAVLIDQAGPGEIRELSEDGSEINVTITNREFKMAAIDSTLMIYEPHAETMDLDDLRIVAEKIILTRSELIERGISRKEVEDLVSIDVDTEVDQLERSRREHLINDAETWEGERIQCWEVYYLIDMDGDGISERWRFLMAGDGQNPQVILEQEEVYCVPYATGTATIYPHRLMGISLFDQLKHLQDAKTAAYRQWIDNLVVGNNCRYAVVESLTNMDDFLNTRPGGGVRVTSLDAIMPLPYNDVGASAQALMDYTDKVRSERGGAALDMLGAEAQMVGQTAFGTERIFSSREQRVSTYARNLAETLIRNTYLLMHKYLRMYSNAPMMVQIAGEYVQVDPAQWPERKRLNVTAGLSPGQRNHIQNTLSTWFQGQMALAQGGSLLADEETMHSTALDWFKMAGLENPENYVVDPASPKGKQAQQMAMQQQQMQQQAMQQMQQQVMQMQVTLEQQRLELERWKHESELDYKYYDTDKDAEMDEAKIVADVTGKIYEADIDATARQEQASRTAAGAGGSD